MKIPEPSNSYVMQSRKSSYSFQRVIKFALFVFALDTSITSRPLNAMQWIPLSNSRILARSDLVAEGEVDRVIPSPDAAARGMSDWPRDPAEKPIADAASVAYIKIIRTLKGQANASVVSVVYWSDFGDREQSHFSKYVSPRRLKRGQRMVFALLKLDPTAFSGFSISPEARGAEWMFALDSFFDGQIQTSAFMTEALGARRDLHGKKNRN